MRIQVLLSLQRALWEQVTPDLRGFAASWTGSEHQGSVHARFLYEGAVGELQSDCTSRAETYCIADFTDGVDVRFEAVPNADRNLNPGEEWIYLRREAEAS